MQGVARFVPEKLVSLPATIKPALPQHSLLLQLIVAIASKASGDPMKVKLNSKPSNNNPRTPPQKIKKTSP